MGYDAQNYDHLLGMQGFSDTLLKNHFTLYQGYVKNTNKAAELLHKYSEEGKTAEPEYGEIKRRFGWEFNGMRLHELYFENMSKEKKSFDEQNAPLAKQMAQDFGSPEKCGKEFAAAGGMRGIGWVVTTFDPVGKRLFNVWINEHDLGFLAGTVPLVVMDVFEHAFMIDYGLKKADYIKAFTESIDWDVVNKRFSDAQRE